MHPVLGDTQPAETSRYDDGSAGIDELLVYNRTASKIASSYVLPEEHHETSWEKMRDWHHHFILTPKLPMQGDWDFTIREDGPSEVIPKWLSEMAAFWGAAAEVLDPDAKTVISSGAAHQTSCDIKVGLCVPLKSRGNQIKLSLATSIANLWSHRRWCKIYLVDFDSNDGIVEWIRSHFHEAMTQDLLRVYVTKDLGQLFHSSSARNTAHRMAIEDGCHIVVNLDADNVVDPGFARDVVTRMGRRNMDDPGGCDVVHYLSSPCASQNATYGRIAQFSVDFEYLRGYDEDSRPTADHENDLLLRYRMIRRRICGSSPISTVYWDGIDGRKAYPTIAFQKDKLEAVIQTEQVETVDSVKPIIESISWGDTADKNLTTLNMRRECGYVIRNTSRSTYPYFGCENVERVKPYVKHVSFTIDNRRKRAKKRCLKEHPSETWRIKK